MLNNAYLLAKIGADTAENERNLAEHLPTFGNYSTDACRSFGLPSRLGHRQDADAKLHFLSRVKLKHLSSSFAILVG